MRRPTDHTPRCTCQGGEHGPSTHRAASHFSRCRHSTLASTTRRYRPQKYRRIPGTKGLTVSLDER